MLTYPTWKSDYGTKPKWKTARGFELATESFGTKITDNTAWKQLPLVGYRGREKYIDGHAAMGDIARKRIKKKEQNVPFMSTIGKNLWQKNLHISQSIRTG